MLLTRSSIGRFISLAASLSLLGCGDAPKSKPKPPEPPKAAQSAPVGSTSPAAAPSTVAPPNAATPPVVAPPSGAAAGKTSGHDDDATKLEVAGLIAPKPATWTWQQPTMQFRTLQYAVPGAGDSTSAAELIVSVFAGGDGGPLEGNITRWAGQFRTDDGQSATPVRSEKEIDGMKIILVELKGAYMAMGSPAPKSDSMQLAAIIQAPGRNVFIRLVGPAKTVEAQRANWTALVDGLKKTS